MSKIGTMGTVMITVNKISFEAIYSNAQRSRIFGRASLFLTQTNLIQQTSFVLFVSLNGRM